MSTLLEGGSLVLTVLGLVCGVLVLVRRRDVQLALAVLLEFLLAVGLLRLSDRPTDRAILAAALIVVIRALVSVGLRQGSGPGTAGYRSEPGGGEGPQAVI